MVFYVFQYYYLEENFSSVIWTKFADLKEKRNHTGSVINNYANPKPIQIVLKNKNKKDYNCSDAFISVSDKGRLGNNICQFFTLYFFKFEFGIRAVVSSKMYKTLIRIFETVPLPHLPNSCFKTRTKSIYSNSFDNIYRKLKSNVIDDKNTLNFTNIAHYTFINPYPCPLSYFWSYRQNFHTELKLKKKNVNTAKHIIENALKTRKFNISEIVLVGNGNINNPEIDYTLLTLCDHHIRGLGTFGITSAFLGKGSAVIFRRRGLNQKPILTIKELSKSNFTCDSSKFYYVDE
ncbi:Galactoside 2-alpha-L-fucosyltransferase 2 [Armadillidium nasatum]|uniref:L-Fucosyltransferase n=1 Tax=Armadillidium nasatum TaxID=96803 RepID=A0A5N5SH80_9CRUS|nr:Galactoside 2-alpha-L-fucosyltransferase 2 [Armadillidium nasatum]